MVQAALELIQQIPDSECGSIALMVMKSNWNLEIMNYLKSRGVNCSVLNNQPLYQQRWDNARGNTGCRNGADLHIGTASTAACIRLIFFYPFLYHAITRDGLLDIVPAQAQPQPELWIEPVPVVEKVVQVANFVEMQEDIPTQK